MPWTIKRDHDECPSENSFGVVTKEDGELVGCLATREQARRLVRKLYAEEAAEGATKAKAPLPEAEEA